MTHSLSLDEQLKWRQLLIHCHLSLSAQNFFHTLCHKDPRSNAKSTRFNFFLIFLKSSPEDTLTDFRKKGREVRGRNRDTDVKEKHWSAASHTGTKDWTCNLRMYPDQDWTCNLMVHGTMFQPTEPVGQGEKPHNFKIHTRKNKTTAFKKKNLSLLIDPPLEILTTSKCYHLRVWFNITWV